MEIWGQTSSLFKDFFNVQENCTPILKAFFSNLISAFLIIASSQGGQTAKLSREIPGIPKTQRDSGKSRISRDSEEKVPKIQFFLFCHFINFHKFC